jgi:hypothetical protein
MIALRPSHHAYPKLVYHLLPLFVSVVVVAVDYVALLFVEPLKIEKYHE